MSAESQSADADTATEEDETDDGYTIYPQVTQHPHSIIVGEEIVDVVTSATLDGNQEKTGHGVGVVYKNPTVAKGSLWQQRDVPEGFDSASEFNDTLKRALAEEGDYVSGVELEGTAVDAAIDRVDAALDDGFDADDAEYRDYNLPVDYKVANTDDRDCEVQSVEFDGEEKVTGVDVGGGSYQSERVDEFEHDEVMVWYGGMSGQFIMRALDFNGRPSARDKEDGYLVKGLLQHPLGWFDRDTENHDVPTTDRSELARSADNGGLGRPPRVARPVVLRSDIEGEEVFVEIDRFEGGNMLAATTAFNDFEDDNVEDATQIEPTYEQEPEETITEEFDVDNATDIYELYRGDGWQDPIEGDGEAEDTSGASFDVDVDTDGDEEERPTENEVEFAENIAERLAGTGASPEDNIFPVDGENTDLEGLVGHNADQFTVTPDVDVIREIIHENVSHLSEDDL